MTEKDYNAIRLKNGIQNAISEALADIAIVGIQRQIAMYQQGTITADEFLKLLREETAAL